MMSPVCEAAPASASPMPSSTERLPRCATSGGMSRERVSDDEAGDVVGEG